MQESARKDIGCAFRCGALLTSPTSWKPCIILHNIIPEDQRDTYKPRAKINDYDTSNYSVTPSHNRGGMVYDHVYISRLNAIMIRPTIRNYKMIPSNTYAKNIETVISLHSPPQHLPTSF